MINLLNPRARALKTIRDYRNNVLQYTSEQFKIAPDPWQEKALVGFANLDQRLYRQSLQACAGPGKAHCVNELIETVNGPIKIQDIKAGDFVFGKDGLKTKVVATQCWDNLDLRKVIFDDGTFEIVAKEHLWKVKDCEGRIGVTETQDMEFFGVKRDGRRNGKYRSLYQFKIPSSGAWEREKKEYRIHPYVMGQFLGNGCRRQGYISTDDESCIERILRFGGYSQYKRQNQKNFNWTVYGMRNDFVKHYRDILYSYSYEKWIPEEYFLGSIEQRIDLLRGMMDADGCAKKNGGVEYCSTSPRLIEGFKKLVRGLGCKAVDRKVDTRDRPCYSVRINAPFNPFYLDRKASRWKQPPPYRTTKTIVGIEDAGKGDGYCIEVEAEDGLYQTANGTVTHNSAVLAWCGLWFLCTQGEVGNHPKGVVTACTADNLKDNLWTEYSKWNEISPLCSAILKWTKTRIFAKDHPHTWWLSARAFNNSADAEQKGRVLSGIHSKYVLYQVDESGDIPITVMKTGNQALSTADIVFGRMQQAGNPTSTEGMLYAALDDEGTEVIRITGDPDDPNRSTRVGLELAKTEIKKYGRNDPWVMAYILGQFPKGGINTLFSAHDVDQAMKKGIHEDDYKNAQKRIGVDVARFGFDSTVIFPRQGLRAFNYITMRQARTDEIASRVIAGKNRWNSEVEFVDGTGGYGAGVVDSMIRAGAQPYEINFSSKPDDARYKNKRAEMWFRFSDWVKRGGVLPKCVDLKKELTSQTYGFSKDGKMILEDKEMIRKRLGYSPDRGDALALTFAIQEMQAQLPNQRQVTGGIVSDYDPLHKDRV